VELSPQCSSTAERYPLALIFNHFYHEYYALLKISTRIFHLYAHHRITRFPNIIYEGHLESKERFAIKKYLLIAGKKKNMQVLSHTFTYFST